LAELTEYFLQDAALVGKPVERPKLPFVDGEIGHAKRAPCRVERILNLQHVNALPSGQELQFGTQLTLIYGQNGAGKSGYARPLASAAFSRGERDVLPNARAKRSLGNIQADIEISYGGVRKTIRWTNGKRCSELQGLYVFDSESVTAHLCAANTLSFSPAGLSALTQLAEVTDLVRDRIRMKIDERERVQDFASFFAGDSAVKSMLTDLNSQTDVAKLEVLSTFDAADMEREKRTKQQIGDLQSLDVPKRIAMLNQESADLERLVVAIADANRYFGASSEDTARGLIAEAVERRKELAEAGVEQFKFERFTKIGTGIWQAFVVAAKALGEAESQAKSTYPKTGDPCLLCRQPLASGAAELISRLWAFVGSDSRGRLIRAERACADKARELARVNLDYFGLESGARRLLENELPLLIPQIEAHLGSCRARRAETMNGLESYNLGKVAPLIVINLDDLRRIQENRRKKIEELRKSDVAAQLARASKDLRELEHRTLLSQYLPKIRDYLNQKRWAERARSALGSTRAITTFHNTLFEELITRKYASLFETNLGRFQRKMNATIATRGMKGGTVHQIVLDPDKYLQTFPIDRILSDGEKRIVAICDFLTEAGMDSDNAGIVFDDPVTSLDDNWRSALAQCLTEQATERQVIIFSHDLAFLYLINSAANKINVDVVSHWIREENGVPGFVYLNNSPVCEKDYKTTAVARDCHSKAKNASPADEQGLLQQGFGALRSSYEALVVFELFNSVVLRFEERISFDRLEEVFVDKDLTQQIIERMAALSRHIDAHLHSDRFAPVKPTHDDLLSEIDAFESIRKRLKDIKRAQKTLHVTSFPSDERAARS
jgi:recombinational DNA repair ATPase RecF